MTFPVSRRWLWLGVVFLAEGAIFGCSNLLSFQDLTLDLDASGAETGVDGPLESGEPTFDLALSSSSVIVEPGAVLPVTVTITRKNGFSDTVTLTLASAPEGITANTVIPASMNSAVLNVSAPTAATLAKTGTAVLIATSASNVVKMQPIFIRVGHLLVGSATNTEWTVPEDVIKVSVAVWGAGGGAGGAVGQYEGGVGGAGGFSQGDLVVSPGSLFHLAVGQGGGSGAYDFVAADGGGGGGGGGGGVSIFGAVDAAANLSMTVAAGGGGGGTGGNGFAGGAPGIGGDGAGLPGCPQSTTTQSGNGGAPNGTAGTFGGDGGGSGKGGAAGKFCDAGGYMGTSFSNTHTAAAIGATAPSTSHPFYQVPTAIGGVPYDAGGPGRIVVYLSP